MIQNDIGTTHAHVLVVSVEGSVVTITHSDVHEPRAKFFVGLFDSFPIKWTRLVKNGPRTSPRVRPFISSPAATKPGAARRSWPFLEAIGAALVFLIDWNKARKALRKLVSNSDAVAVLDWGARHEVGHRAFLQLGGANLIASAVRQAARAHRLRRGTRRRAWPGGDPQIPEDCAQALDRGLAQRPLGSLGA